MRKNKFHVEGLHKSICRRTSCEHSVEEENRTALEARCPDSARYIHVNTTLTMKGINWPGLYKLSDRDGFHANKALMMNRGLD